MGWWVLEIRRDPLGDILVAGGEYQKGGAWVARITGLHETYRYAREFLGRRVWLKDNRYERPHAKGCVEVHVPLTELREGDLLDIRTGGSSKYAYREYYVYENRDVRRISEEEMRRRLGEKPEGGEKCTSN